MNVLKRVFLVGLYRKERHGLFWGESNKEYIFITEVTLLSSIIYLPSLSCILTHILLFVSLIRTQADDMVGLWVFRLTDSANEDVMWNSQFYHIIHKQLYYGIKLVETI